MPGEDSERAVLSGAEIARLVRGEPPLVGDYLDLERQLQPNGIDLTLDRVWRPAGAGQIGVTDDERILAPRDEVALSEGGYYDLSAGSYVIRLNEVVHLPPDLMALGQPRSSLLRCGVALPTAVWDAGYRGRSEGLLVVHNPAGFRVRQNARILQLVFLRLMHTTPYSGRFQDENLGER